jgi:hypothetical protein
MMPGYISFLKAIALKQIQKPLDVPAVSLGIGESELLNPIRHGRAVLSEPRLEALTGGIVPGQSYDGLVAGVVLSQI